MDTSTKTATQPLETISRWEADGLVRHTRINNKGGIYAGSFMALDAGFFLAASIWYKATQDWAPRIFMKGSPPFSFLPDVDYDKMVIGNFALLTLLGVYTAYHSIKSLAQSREYRFNPVEYMRKRYNKILSEERPSIIESSC